MAEEKVVMAELRMRSLVKLPKFKFAHIQDDILKLLSRADLSMEMNELLSKFLPKCVQVAQISIFMKQQKSKRSLDALMCEYSFYDSDERLADNIVEFF